MINMPQDQPISSPLYGQQVPRDGLVQALMGGAGQMSPSSGGNAASGLAGLNPMAIAGLLKLLQPGMSTSPYAGAAPAGTGLPVLQGPSANPTDSAAGAGPNILLY